MALNKVTKGSFSRDCSASPARLHGGRQRELRQLGEAPVTRRAGLGRSVQQGQRHHRRRPDRLRQTRMVESGNRAVGRGRRRSRFRPCAPPLKACLNLDFKVIQRDKIDPRFVSDYGVGSFFFSFVLGYNEGNRRHHCRTGAPCLTIGHLHRANAPSTNGQAPACSNWRSPLRRTRRQALPAGSDASKSSTPLRKTSSGGVRRAVAATAGVR